MECLIVNCRNDAIDYVNDSKFIQRFCQRNNQNNNKNIIQFSRQNIQRSDLYQYRLQAWNMANMEETYLPDFSQSKRLNLNSYNSIRITHFLRKMVPK